MLCLLLGSGICSLLEAQTDPFLEKLHDAHSRVDRMIPKYDSEELRKSLIRFFEIYSEVSAELTEKENQNEPDSTDLISRFDMLDKKMQIWKQEQDAISSKMQDLIDDYEQWHLGGQEELEKIHFERRFRRLKKRESRNQDSFRRIQLSVVRILERRIEWKDEEFFLNSVFTFLEEEIKPRIAMMESLSDSLDRTKVLMEDSIQLLNVNIQSKRNEFGVLKSQFEERSAEFGRTARSRQEQFSGDSLRIVARLDSVTLFANREIDTYQEAIRIARLEEDSLSVIVQLSNESLQSLQDERASLQQESTLLVKEIGDLTKERQRKEKELQQANKAIKSATQFSDRLQVGLVLLLLGIAVASLITNFVFRKNEEKLRIANRRLNLQHDKLEILLRELQHRVKNNLQTVASLLNLQARESDQDYSRSSLQDARGRVMAMGLVHEKLYHAGKVSKVNISDFIRELVEELKRSHGLNQGELRSSLQVHNIVMDADRATPIGLIINELVTNCFKHAFAGHPSPELYINFFKLEEGRLKLIIKDNGSGMPDKAERGNTSFGLTMVDLLIEQLGAKLQIENKKGLSYQIEFDTVLKGKNN